VWSIAEAKTTLYAGMGAGKGLYAWDGAAWNQITLLPAGTIHGLAYSAPGNYLFVSVFGKGVYRCSVDDDGMVAGCSGYSSGLTTQGTRELQIHDDTIVAGSDDGAWYRPLQP
jgi:hypothetical protein